jgi:Zn-dependent protease with chaperone function
MRLESITGFSQCVSSAERRQRFGVAFTNLFLWVLIGVATVALTAVSFGTFLIILGLSWLVRSLFSGYHVRRLQALGATVSPTQFPQVHQALVEVCSRFGVARPSRVIVVSSGETNAFAVKFARKKVILILSELLEGIVDQPAELRALLGHELCHTALDHGSRGTFEIYKPARYKAARELTCDNAGFVAAGGDLENATAMIKKLCVGKVLYRHLSDAALVEEALDIYSGFVGWLIRSHLTHPPAGARLQNLQDFARDLWGGV